MHLSDRISAWLTNSAKDAFLLLEVCPVYLALYIGLFWKIFGFLDPAHIHSPTGGQVRVSLLSSHIVIFSPSPQGMNSGIQDSVRHIASNDVSQD